MVLCRLYSKALKSVVLDRTELYLAEEAGVNFDGEEKKMEDDASGEQNEDSTSSSSDSSSEDEQEDEDPNDPATRGRALLRAEKKRQQEIKTANIGSSAIENKGAVDPSTLPIDYNSKRVLQRLALVSSQKRSWDWDSHDPWPPGLWNKADAVLLDENKLQLENGAAEILHQIIRSENWTEENYDEGSIQRILLTFCGHDKLYHDENHEERPGRKLAVHEMIVLLEDLDKLDDERIDYCCHHADLQSFECYALRKCLRRRKILQKKLKKLKDDTLVIVIRPERVCVPLSEDEQKEEEEKEGKHMFASIRYVEQQGPEESSSRQRMVSNNNGKDDAERDEGSKHDATNRTGGEEGEGRKQEKEHKDLSTAGRRSSTSPGSFLLGGGDDAVKIEWRKPTRFEREHLFEQWSKETLFKIRDNVHFQHIDDNFVFKNMKKASLWDDGFPIAAMLYRRIPRSAFGREENREDAEKQDEDGGNQDSLLVV